jgi:GntR family transcriptional regulator, transcriptional repressor for pyruvate dehydrogenase complex
MPGRVEAPLTTEPQLLDSPLRRSTVPDLIAQRIREVISTELLQPGERLPAERELAAMLGASRPALREALRSLQARGDVEIRRGSGVFVAGPVAAPSLSGPPYTVELTIAELFDMREVLELPAAAWAAVNHDEAGLAAVTRAYEELAAAGTRPRTGWPRLQQLDAAFHLRIVEAAGNRFLARALGVLYELPGRGPDAVLRVPGRIAKSRREHKRILDALLAGDPAGARRAAAAHIRGARSAAGVRGPSAP